MIFLYIIIFAELVIFDMAHLKEQVDDIKEDPKAIHRNDLNQKTWLAHTLGSGNDLWVVVFGVMRLCVPVNIIFRERIAMPCRRKMPWPNFKVK